MEDASEFSEDCTSRARALLLRKYKGDESAVGHAMTDYEGSYPSLAEYVRQELDEHLPPFLSWMFDFLAMDAVAAHWLTERRNWVLPDRKTKGVHVFLAPRPADLPRDE